MEPEIAPPDAYLTVFILVGHPLLETEPRRGRLAVLDLLHQEVEHTLPVLGAHLRHLGIEPRWPAIAADTDALRRERLQLQPLKALELENRSMNRSQRISGFSSRPVRNCHSNSSVRTGICSPVESSLTSRPS